MIHVAYITDEAYTLPTVVSIRSLAANLAETSECCIHVILAGEISERSRKRLESCATSRVRLEMTAVDRVIDTDEEIPSHLYVSKAALTKFKLAELLPDINKVLYLDGDTLIQKDITPLYETDIENYYLAAVADLPAMQGGWHKKMDTLLYFNSGIMLINSKKWRENDIKNQLIVYKLHEQYPGFFMDQNALNAVCKGKVKFVDIRYNYMPAPTKEIQSSDFSEELKAACFGDENSNADLHEYCKDAVIIHLASPNKPWKNPMIDLYAEWTDYAEVPELWRCIRNYYVAQENETRQITTEHRQMLDAHAQILEEQRQRLHAQAQILAEQRQLIDVQVQQLNAQAQALEEQRQINEELYHKIRYCRNRTLYGAVRWIARKLMGKPTD